ncbi:transposase domain-containing protein [Streptomyces sp. NPDC002265]|uniref:transposase domain-containing protein n=1 Tax=Streptomyces sp. NPDC002265 TaxID=3154415 RepID=UPI00331D3E94
MVRTRPRRAGEAAEGRRRRGARPGRRGNLPARVVVYFVLALAFFERSSYQAAWDKITARCCTSPWSRILGCVGLRHAFANYLVAEPECPQQPCQVRCG